MTEFLQENPSLLAFVIFGARVLDVSLGTLRTILVFRGHRLKAAGLGFVEILIWLTAAGPVLQNLGAWYLAVAYAGGFAAGNVVGIWLEEKLALGSELVRAISSNPGVALVEPLRRAGHDVVELPGHDVRGPVEVLFVVERRRRVSELLQLIRRSDPGAICTVSDVKRHGDSSAFARHQGGRRSELRSAGKKT